METRKISDTAMEVTEPKISVYEYNDLINQKNVLLYEIEELQKKIDTIDVFLAECAKLDIKPVTILDDKIIL